MIKNGLSPAEIEGYLESVGYTTEKLADQVGGIYDALIKAGRLM